MKASDSQFMLAYIKYYIANIHKDILDGVAELKNDLQAELQEVRGMERTIETMQERTASQMDDLIIEEHKLVEAVTDTISPSAYRAAEHKFSTELKQDYG